MFEHLGVCTCVFICTFMCVYIHACMYTFAITFHKYWSWHRWLCPHAPPSQYWKASYALWTKQQSLGHHLKHKIILLSFLKVRKEAKIRNQYNQLLHLTQYIPSESDKNTIKHHMQESQEFSPFPAGDHKTAINRRQDSMTNKKHK